MIRVRHGDIVHWRHHYGTFTACTQRNDAQSLVAVEEPPSCLECIARVE